MEILILLFLLGIGIYIVIRQMKETDRLLDMSIFFKCPSALDYIEDEKEKEKILKEMNEIFRE